jgi:hypothetical protein
LFVVHEGWAGTGEDYVAIDRRPTDSCCSEFPNAIIYSNFLSVGQPVLEAGEWKAAETYEGCSNALPEDDFNDFNDCENLIEVVSCK